MSAQVSGLPSLHRLGPVYQKKHKHSFIYTAKKAAIVFGIGLSTTALATGVTLAVITTAGVAIFPIAATAGSISLLSAGGAGGIVGGCFGLNSLKVNKAAKKVLKASGLIQEGTGQLVGAYEKQRPVVKKLTEKILFLERIIKDLEKKLNKGDRELQKTSQELQQTEKKQKEFKKNVQQIATLTASLDNVLEKLKSTTASTKETQKLAKQVEKLNKQLENIGKTFPYILQNFKENNKDLAELIALLQKTNQSLSGLGPSTELEQIIRSIRQKA